VVEVVVEIQAAAAVMVVQVVVLDKDRVLILGLRDQELQIKDMTVGEALQVIIQPLVAVVLVQ
tara:strand:+ start:192 stop:380 length:189 start_codon:yes stop_codon:yes gene_type:complete